MKKLIILIAVVLAFPSFSQDNNEIYKKALIEHNKKVVNFFFQALEQKDYTLLKTITDEKGKLVSFNPETNQSENTIGREAIGARFEELYKGFSEIQYQKEVNVTEDPSNVVVKYTATLVSMNGDKIKSNALITFKLKDGKIVEFEEFNNPVVMAKRQRVSVN
jgi:ketosteroid isomerase-like protein